MALRVSIASLLLQHQRIISCLLSCQQKNCHLGKQQSRLKFLEPRCLHVSALMLQISQTEVDASSSNGSESDGLKHHSSVASHEQSFEDSQEQSQQSDLVQIPPPGTIDTPTQSPPPRFRRIPISLQRQQPPIAPALETASVTSSQSPSATPAESEAVVSSQLEVTAPARFQPSGISNVQSTPPFASFEQFKPVSSPQTSSFSRSSPPMSNVVSIVPDVASQFAPPPVVILSLNDVKKQMTELINKLRPAEAFHLYNEWLKDISPETLEKNTPDMRLWNLSLYAESLCGSTVNELLARVEALKDLGLSPSRDTFSVLFRSISSSRDHKSIEPVFSKITELGVEVEGEWFDISIMTCIQNFSVDLALKYVQMMAANGLYPHNYILDRLVQQCCRTGRTSNGLDIVKWCKAKEIYPSLGVIEDLADGCIESANSDGALLALELAYERQRSSQFPSMNEAFRIPGTPSLDEGTMIALLEIAAQSGNLPLATKAWDMLCRSLKNSRPPSTAAFLSRIHASVAAGDLTLALVALLDMETEYALEAEKDVFSPFSSLNSFVSGCSRGGFATVDAAYYKVEEMSNVKKKVPLAALNCLILGCSNIWDVDRAYQTFDSVWSVFGLKPNVHSYNALLDAFGKTRKIENAVKLYDHMVDSGVQPNYQTYCLLINSHVVNRDTQAAMEVFDYLVDAGYTIDKVTAAKLRRRCIREGDQESLMRIVDMSKKCKYSFGFLGDARKKALFSLS